MTNDCGGTKRLSETSFGVSTPNGRVSNAMASYARPYIYFGYLFWNLQFAAILNLQLEAISLLLV